MLYSVLDMVGVSGSSLFLSVFSAGHENNTCSTVSFGLLQLRQLGVSVIFSLFRCELTLVCPVLS